MFVTAGHQPGRISFPPQMDVLVLIDKLDDLIHNAYDPCR